MKKIKVMHIAQSAGGVERYIYMLLSNMNLELFENILVCSYDYQKEKYEKLVVAFEYVDMLRSINIKKDLLSVKKIRKFIAMYNPDIVYMHSSKAGAVGRIANIGFKNTSIYNPHGWAFNMNCGKKVKMVYKYTEKLLAALCTHIVAISDFEKQSALRERICRENKIKVIVNGVDIDEFYKKIKKATLTKEDLGIHPDAIVFGTVGRLTRQKAPDVFVEFANKMRKRIPNSYFLIVGGGELESEIQELIHRYHLEDVMKITGWVETPMEYIQLFDQAFLLSRWEGFGLVLAEYMLAQKPIVATNVDAIPDLIQNNVNGVLVSADDVDAVYRASIKIADDVHFKEQLINNGVRCVTKNFDIKRVVRETEALMRECDDEVEK